MIEDLRNFALAGNGVVIGSPGVGKTYTLLELGKRLADDGGQYLFLPVDQLGSGSEQDLRDFFPGGGDWLARLRYIDRGSKRQPSVLIFDGFDSARSVDQRAQFLARIQRAVVELHNIWTVIVSACTLTLRLTPSDSLPTPRLDLPTREVRKVTADKCSMRFNVVSRLTFRSVEKR